MLIAAYVEWYRLKLYNEGHVFDQSTAGATAAAAAAGGGGGGANHHSSIVQMSVWWQVPQYLAVGLSEVGAGAVVGCWGGGCVLECTACWHKGGGPAATWSPATSGVCDDVMLLPSAVLPACLPAFFCRRRCSPPLVSWSCFTTRRRM